MGSGPAYGGATVCNSTYHQTFGGFQLGQDVAKLNFWDGWNLHLGTTAGYLETSGDITQGNIQGGSFNSTTQAPFVGTYGVLTKGNFYVDGLVRYDYFQTDLSSPTANIFDQKVDAHGWTLAASTGYNYKVPNSKWFVEPSVGFVWSKESIDPINVASPLPGAGGAAAYAAGNYSGSTQVNDINSMIGRAGLRVGTTVEAGNVVLQPFVAASVWHDFSGDITSHYSSCPNCFFTGGWRSVLAATMTSNNIGTFGQYSVGVAGQVANTGWLGFARLDYREGSEHERAERHRRHPLSVHAGRGSGGLSGQGPRLQGRRGGQLERPLCGRHRRSGVRAGQHVLPELGDRWRKSAYPPDTDSGWLCVQSAAGRGAGRWYPGVQLAVGQLGLWHRGRRRLGPEFRAPISANRSTRRLMSALGSVNNSLFQTTCHDNINWTATVAGRLGYAWLPHTLVYGKAGVAIAGESFSETCNLGPINGSNGTAFSAQNCVNATGAFVNSASVNTTAVGWTLGYGTEFAFTQHWTAKAEFDWLDFGHKSVTLSDGTTINTYQRAAQAKVGVNYKW